MQVVGGSYGGGGGGYAAPRDDSNDGSSVDEEDDEYNGGGGGNRLEELYNVSLPSHLQNVPSMVAGGSASASIPLPTTPGHQHRSPNLPSRRGGGGSASSPPSTPGPQTQINHHQPQTSSPPAPPPPQQQRHNVTMEELDSDAATPMMRVEMALRRMAVLPKLSDALYNPTNQKRSAADRYADANEAVADIRKCSPWRRHPNNIMNNNTTTTASADGEYEHQRGDEGQQQEHHQQHLEAAGVSPQHHHQQSTLELELLGMYTKGGTSSVIDQSAITIHGGGNGTSASFQSHVGGGGGGSVITFAHNSVFSETPKNRATPRRRMLSEAGESVLRRPSPHRQNQATSQHLPLSQQRINSMTGGRRSNSIINNNMSQLHNNRGGSGAAGEEEQERMSHPGGISRSCSMGSSASFATVRSTAGAPSSYFRDIHDDDNNNHNYDSVAARGVPPSSRHVSGYDTPMTATSNNTAGNKSVVVPVYDSVASQLHISIRITVPQLLLHPILFPQLEEATVTLSSRDLAFAFETNPNPFSLRDLLALPTSTLTRGLCAAVLDALVYPAMRRWLGDNNNHTFSTLSTSSPEELLEFGLEGGTLPVLRAVRDVLGPAIPLLQSLRYVSEGDVLAAWPTDAAFQEAKVPNPTDVAPTKNTNTNNGGNNSAADTTTTTNRRCDGSDDEGTDEEDEEENQRRREAAANMPKFIYLSSPESAISSYRELHAWGRQLTARHLVEGATQFLDVRRTRLPNGNLLEHTSTSGTTNISNTSKEVPLEMFLLCRSRNSNDDHDVNVDDE